MFRVREKEVASFLINVFIYLEFIICPQISRILQKIEPSSVTSNPYLLRFFARKRPATQVLAKIMLQFFMNIFYTLISHINMVLSLFGSVL